MSPMSPTTVTNMFYICLSPYYIYNWTGLYSLCHECQKHQDIWIPLIPLPPEPRRLNALKIPGINLSHITPAPLLQRWGDRKELWSGRQLIEGYQLWGKEHEPTSSRRMPLSVLGERCDSCYQDQSRGLEHRTRAQDWLQGSVVTSWCSVNHHQSLGGLGGWDYLQIYQTLIF